MLLHSIQRQILIKLAQNDILKYSQIKLDAVENDLFNYHLQYLVKIGYVDKLAEGYKLSGKGLERIFMMDSQGTEYQGLRVSVLVYIIKEVAGQKLLLAQKRNRAPYRDDDNPGIAGKVLKGELIEVAAQRKVFEETGLSGHCKFIGVIRKIRRHPNDVIDDGLFHVCICNNPTGELTVQNEFGENHWVDFDQAAKLQTEFYGKGEYAMQVLQRVLAGDLSPFYFEEVNDIT